ncbi:MAG: matrixin family metalloprotease [Candidatus Aenigmarchaeota archaeon]|nr:matrixin family metalloprotease [Candidatus Aenigmarchaeota archaeon]
MKILMALAAVVFLAGCVNYAAERGIPQASGQIAEPPKISSPVTEEKFDYRDYRPPEESVDHPLLLKNPVARSPMPYFIINESEVNAYKYNLTLENIRIAFGAWENATKGKVKFIQVEEKPMEGIIIYVTPKNYYTYDIQPGASRQEVAGEASPVYYRYPNHSVIVGGEITVGPLYGTLENRVQIMHEIGHIMGFGHSNNSHSILFPVVAYSQEMTPDIREALDELYGNVPA